MWKWRNLSISGKIQIIETFAIPKLMFRASVIPIPNELVKEVNSIFYNFIWNGKDKVKVAGHSFRAVSGVVQKPAGLLKSKTNKNKNKRGVKTMY